jgi:hypothetical protein
MCNKRKHNPISNLGSYAKEKWQRTECWVYAKRSLRYRLLPPSSSEDDLKKNTLASLEAVPLTSIHQ